MPDCPKCGKPHTGCKAHNKAGNPCASNKLRPGATVCRQHGGESPNAIAAAQRRVAEATATKTVTRLNARRDIHPLDALEELVHTQAGIVAYWAHQVEQLGDDELTWGTTRVKDGGDDRGTTKEAKPHIAYVLWHEARVTLAKYATDALKAGVDERRVALAERHGAAVAAALRGIIDDQWEAIRKWIPAADRDAALADWNESLAVSAPKHLRALAGGGEAS